jgi:hypothetical protein
MRALVDVYPGVEREDEMVAAFDFCLHGKGGAAPSIDTALTDLSTPRTSTTFTPTPASRSRTPPTGKSSPRRRCSDRLAGHQVVGLMTEHLGRRSTRYVPGVGQGRTSAISAAPGPVGSSTYVFLYEAFE